MSNASLMNQFVDTYGTEIAALVADLELQDVRISFDGRRPDGLREDPTLVWEYQQSEPDDSTKFGFAIRFCWNNIIDQQHELRYGLIALAQCFHVVSQQVRDVLTHQSLECTCDRCIELAHRARLQEAENYAYEAVQRLFTLFPDNEVKAIKDYGCVCKRCRKDALRGLRQSGRPLAA